MATSSTIPDAPPPWTLKAECFWLFHHTSPSTPPHASWYTHPPSSSSSSPSTFTPEFHGGLGTVQLLRYSSSPVGPYDELIFIPGKFSHPTLPTYASPSLAVTRIYVSSVASVLNGRRNWNIPKTLAEFTWTELEGGKGKRVEVKTPGGGVFFAAEMQEIAVGGWGLVRMPFDTRYMPMKSDLMMAPLVRGEGEGEVETEGWKGVRPRMSGVMRGVWIQGGLEGGALGDGIGFPVCGGVWRVGCWWKDMTVEFPAADDEVKEGKKTV